MVLVYSSKEIFNRYQNLLPGSAMVAQLAEKQKAMMGAKMALPIGYREEFLPLSAKVARQMMR